MADVTSSGLCSKLFVYARSSSEVLRAPAPITISLQPIRSA